MTGLSVGARWQEFFFVATNDLFDGQCVLVIILQPMSWLVLFLGVIVLGHVANLPVARPAKRGTGTANGLDRAN